MPSNRSKKNVFHKEADDTLKRQLVSSEFRKHIVLAITGKEAHNGADALLVTSSNQEYIKLENFYNRKLASYITSLRHEIADKIKNKDYILCPDLCLQDTLAEGAINDVSAYSKSFATDKAEEDKTRNKEMKIIPVCRFEDYWTDRKLIVDDLIKYNKVSYLCSDINRKIIDDYSYSAMSVLRHTYGSSIPVIKYDIEHYKVLLKIYEKYKDRYNLAYPSFPEEHLIKKREPATTVNPSRGGLGKGPFV